MLVYPGAQPSLLDPEDFFLDLPPGPYLTSDDAPNDDNDSVLALEEAPDYLKRYSNKDNPIAVDSSSEDENAPLIKAGPSKRKRTTGDLSDDEPTYDFTNFQKGRRANRKRTKSTTVPSMEPTPAFTHSALPSSSPPIPGPSTPRSYLAEDHLTHVLEILPDIDSEWALRSITEEMILRQNANPANRVVEIALEMVGGYPKFAAKKKEKAKERISPIPGEKEQYISSAYRSQFRMGPTYNVKSIARLEGDFPLIPAPHIRNNFYAAQSLYVPAYMRLLEHTKLSFKPYMELKRARNGAKGKYKLKSADNSQIESQDTGIGSAPSDLPLDQGALEFDNELKWLLNHLEAEKADAEEARRLATEQALAGGAGIECGCCFDETLLEEMIQCNEGHLFCRQCAKTHAETKLGEQSVSILCMDQSGCTSPFSESELSRLLPSKSLQLYHRLKQAKDLEQAEIEGLESCPSCPYAAVIDNPHEKLFRCMNEDCGQVTCRGCRRQEHIPRSCAEVEADLKLNHRHTVEDAMSEALIRRCPKCEKPYIKESGCNKIYCTKCNTISCYVCQEVVQGYEHFDQNPAESSQPKHPGKCKLWDRQEKEQEIEAVRAARDAAAARVIARAQEIGVNVNPDDVNVPLVDPVVPDRLNLMLPLINRLVEGARGPDGQPFAPFDLPAAEILLALRMLNYRKGWAGLRMIRDAGNERNVILEREGQQVRWDRNTLQRKLRTVVVRAPQGPDREYFRHLEAQLNMLDQIRPVAIPLNDRPIAPLPHRPIAPLPHQYQAQLMPNLNPILNPPLPPILAPLPPNQMIQRANARVQDEVDVDFSQFLRGESVENDALEDQDELDVLREMEENPARR
uniref:RING-type domain-containing protein n=1 Tax=Kwoniella pini CBS 10737 TaxID=1296096 RepID=A0A1B9I6G4_9TREE|nr:uncharacterized protein I206_03186 [Kwoniella pini CBS 10737]OCF51120.1 hypothetical protein I206_03186 [Kwoniella pini CBS 10737]